MEARDNPEYLRATSQAVEAFRDALKEFLELYVINDSVALGIAPAVMPMKDADPAEIARRHSKGGTRGWSCQRCD